MTRNTKNISQRIALLWHMPAIMILAIYLPGALLGLVLLGDIHAYAFFGMLAMFTVTYYVAYPKFEKLLQKESSTQKLMWKLGDRINWRVVAWLALCLYLLIIGIVIHISEISPLGAALRGGNDAEISFARSGFYTGLTGPLGGLRYLALILGRSIVPLILVSLYYSKHKLRHAALFLLLATYIVSLEKAAAIFAIMPIIIFYLFQRHWKAAAGFTVLMILCIALWTFLSIGGIQRTMGRFPLIPVTTADVSINGPAKRYPPSIPRLANERNAVFYDESLKSERRQLSKFVPKDSHFRGLIETDPVLQPIFFMLNRIIWIPYITAYDWLRFQTEILEGKLTMGRSIGGLSWLFGQPKLSMESMVYDYEFGTQKGIIGSSNTVFFVDAKLAFGWFGAFLYCLLFTFFSAVIFSSKQEALKIASFTIFLTAALSALTATLLSGGLIFYLAICALRRQK
jgi:hypothetical protein